jgi:hypothetical protein
VIDIKIDGERKSLINIPSRIEKLLTYAKSIEQNLADLEQDIGDKEHDLQSFLEAEREGLTRTKIRKDLLQEVCNDQEFCAVSDGVDVKTSEIRRRIAMLQGIIQKMNDEYTEMMNKLQEIRSMLKPQALEQASAEIQQRIRQLEQERAQKNQECTKALYNVRECQRLIEDLEERETLLSYAKKNGLTLVTASTDELILVCRNHQEKIAEKNRRVDTDNAKSEKKRAPSRRTPREPAPYDEEFSMHEAKSYNYQSNAPFSFSQVTGVISSKGQKSKQTKPLNKEKGRDSKHSVSSSHSYYSQESRSNQDDYDQYDDDDIACDCPECRQQQSRYHEQLRKNDGYTIAGAQSARRGNKNSNYNSNAQRQFTFDNGFIKFTNQ